MEIKDMIELMKAVSDNGLTCFELEQDNTKIVMKREKKIAVPGYQETVARAAEEISGTAAHDPSPVPENVISDNVMTSPLVGTFYSSPSPDADDFVKVGDRVKKGQVIGIVEAMKLMNEIESEFDGVVEAVLVKNEETVEFGQPLFRIR